MKKENSSKQSKKGFTLVELLVVVLIIGILAAIALPQYQKASIKSVYATMKSLVHSIYDAQQRYFLDKGGYTLNFNNLDIDIGQEDGIGSYGQRYFPWGYCSLGKEYVYCRNDNMGYEKSYAGERLCLVYSDKSILHEICKQETDNSSPLGGRNYVYL